MGDSVSWQTSGGSAEGKVLRIERSGKINVPDSSFNIEGTEDDPAALIVLYQDGKPTDRKVGHKVSTLNKKGDLEKHGDHDQSSHSPTGGAGKDIQDLSPSDQKSFISRMSSAKDYQEQRKIIDEYKTKLPKKKGIEKHGDHDQSSHGSGNGEDDSEGEDSSEPKNSKPNFVPYKDDSEEEFEELDADDPKWMDTMDYPRKKN